MNKWVALFLVACFWACSGNGSKQTVNDIRELLATQQKAWNDGNIEKFMEGYHQDSCMQFIGAKGVRYGWLATLNAYKNHYPDKAAMGQLYFDIDTIELLDKAEEIGHVNGRWKLIRAKDTPAGHFSLITRRISGKHKIIIDHTW
ncbi:MAG: hypothetical protein ACK5FT_10105 [Sphingomonadales bacterium]|jgi:hypothetical protein